jgi:hypothetical protein
LFSSYMDNAFLLSPSHQKANCRTITLLTLVSLSWF